MRQVNHYNFVQSYFSQQDAQALVNSLVGQGITGFTYQEMVKLIRFPLIVQKCKAHLHRMIRRKQHHSPVVNHLRWGFAPNPKLIALALAAGGAKLVKFAKSQTHGNSKSSTKSQHIYSITDTRSGAIYKYGVSGSN